MGILCVAKVYFPYITTASLSAFLFYRCQSITSLIHYSRLRPSPTLPTFSSLSGLSTLHPFVLAGEDLSPDVVLPL